MIVFDFEKPSQTPLNIYKSSQYSRVGEQWSTCIVVLFVLLVAIVIFQRSSLAREKFRARPREAAHSIVLIAKDVLDEPASCIRL